MSGIQTVEQRIAALLTLRSRVDTELDRLYMRLDVRRLTPRGRPTPQPVLTTPEARAAHAAYAAGDRTPAVIEGQRRYARDAKRSLRARGRAS